MSELSKLRDSKRDNARRPARSTLEQIRDAVVSGVGGYLERQGRYANEGLDLADQGANELRNANPWGALNMPLGALGYLTSPINALLPGSDEIDATNMSPEARRLLTAGTAGMMAVMPGGPKGKGLGRGMASLADDATDAERAALAARLETEATQTGTGSVPASRDQALRNLTETPSNSLVDDYMASLGDPATTTAIVDKLAQMSKDEVMAIAKQIAPKIFSSTLVSSTSTKANVLQALRGHSVMVARDRDIAERIRRGQ